MLYRFKHAVPEPLKRLYHRLLSWLAVLRYRDPSTRMIVIGVTGTNGKTTTSLMIAHALQGGGAKTGAVTTALIKIGDDVRVNTTKMTMPGRFALQRLLRRMADAGCRFVVVETSSQGILQHRHRGIRYDVAVLTNLTPEHIEAHGGFENYKRAKIALFRHTAALRGKRIGGVPIPKVAVLNAGDAHAKDFEMPGFERTVWFGTGSAFDATDITDTPAGVSFTVHGERGTLRVPGAPNAWNASAALAVADALGVAPPDAMRALEKMPPVPGRFEWVDEGQPFRVMVDYAAEPAALEILYRTIAQYPRARLIHVLGSCGGGRDVARRPILGEMAGKAADIVIVTNEDPYDDDPLVIMEHVAEGARAAGKRDGTDLFVVDDRRDAIRTAVSMAKKDDFILLTGKGNEPWICVAGGAKVPWDEAATVRDAIRGLL